MKWKDKITQNWIAGLGGSLLVIGLGLSLRFVHFGNDVPLGEGLINWSYDLPFQFRPDIKADEVVIVYIDEESHRQLNQPYEKAWDRALHARLLERLKTDHAKAVVLDIIFSEPGYPDTNQALAAAMNAHGKVVIGVDYVFTGVPGVASGYTVIYPLDTFRDAAAGVGIVQLVKDSDYGIRQQFPGGYDGTEYVASLPWKAAELADAEITKNPRQRNRERWLNYYGPPGSIPHISYHLALRPDGVPPGFFRDKIVFVGQAPLTGFTGEKKDEYRSPYTWWTRRFSSGVEVHATTFLNLIQGNWLTRTHPGIEFILLLGFGLLFGFGLTSLRPLPAAVAACITMIGMTLVAYLVFWRFRIWFSWLIIPAVQVPVSFIWSGLFNSLKLYVEKRALEKSLALHLSPARVKQILKRPELLQPGAEKQEISILFSDIANFTKTTARMEPGDLFKLLNRYFEMALGCIHHTDGTVIKLIGDAIFAVWNAPFVQPDQQERACRAALMLREQLAQFDIQQHSLPLRTRVGLHTGYAYVGNVGSSSRFDYTAIGESVNLASRLEGLNKHLGTDLLATRDIQKIVEKIVTSRLVGHFRFKGFDRIVEVHELIGPEDQVETTRIWRETFAEALYEFQRRSFDNAKAGFRQTLDLRPGDGPSQFYLEKIKELQTSPLPEDWAGEIEIKEK